MESLLVARMVLLIFCQWFLSLKAPNTTIAEFANTVDPDETAHNLDLQCLPSSPIICNIIPFKLKVLGNFADVILSSAFLALNSLPTG